MYEMPYSANLRRCFSQKAYFDNSMRGERLTHRSNRDYIDLGEQGDMHVLSIGNPWALGELRPIQPKYPGWVEPARVKRKPPFLTTYKTLW